MQFYVACTLNKGYAAVIAILAIIGMHLLYTAKCKVLMKNGCMFGMKEGLTEKPSVYHDS